MKEDSGDPDLEREWLRQDNLIYGGLIGVGVLAIQPFLAAESVDGSALTSVIAFSIAIPLLAALVLVNHQEGFRGRRSPSVIATIARVVALNSAFVGLVAAFWHITWIAGATFLASGVVAAAVHSAGVTRLERAR
jgi:hypothetical protein